MLDKDLAKFVAEQPFWVREGFSRASKGPLTDDDIDALEGLLLSAESMPVSDGTPVDLELAEGDSDVGPSRFELRKVKIRQNVNRLKDGEALTFDPSAGLTLVFGENGSGKSGFTRVLKAAAGTPAASAVQGNVYRSSATKPSAEIWVTEGGREQHYVWNGKPLEPMSQLMVFDREGTSGWLLRDHTIEIAPGGLDRLEHVVAAAKQLRTRLEDKLKSVEGCVEELAALPQRECIQQKLAALSPSTTPDNIRELIRLSEQDDETLENLRGRTASPEDRSRHARLLRQVAASQRSVAGSVKESLEALHQAQTDLPQARGEVRDLETAIRAVDASDEDLELLTSEDWQRLWKAALSLSGENVPAAIGEPCPLCRREVTDEVHRHWGSLSGVLRPELLDSRDQAADRVGQLERQLAAATPPTFEEQAQALGETDGRAALESGLQALSSAVRAAQQGELAYVVPWALPDLIEEEFEKLEVKADGLEKPLSEQEQEDLANREALKELSGLQSECEREVARLAEHSLLGEALASIKPGRLSRAASQHGERIVGNRFRQELSTELHTFIEGAQLADAATRGREGKVTRQLELIGANGKPKLVDILSEGEQTSVSLAVFLAEASLTNSRGCLVFDDPVSSMDHVRRERLAQRIGELAESRQVIVFTHDLVFYSELRKCVPNSALRLIAANQTDAGIVASGKPPVDGRSCDDYLQQLRSNLDAARSIYEHRPADLAEHIHATAHKFRPGIEALVADLVTRGIVRRLDVRVNVSHVTHLAELQPEGLQRIRALWDEVSPYDHTSGAARGPLPCSIALVERWADEFDELIELFTPR